MNMNKIKESKNTAHFLMCTDTSRVIAAHFIVLCRLKVSGSPASKQVYQHHLANSTCLLYASVLHCGNSCNISQFFTVIIFAMVSVISDI